MGNSSPSQQPHAQHSAHWPEINDTSVARHVLSGWDCVDTTHNGETSHSVVDPWMPKPLTPAPLPYEYQRCVWDFILPYWLWISNIGKNWQVVFPFLNIGIANLGEFKILAGLSHCTWKILPSIGRSVASTLFLWCNRHETCWYSVMLHSPVTLRHLKHSGSLTGFYNHSWSTQVFWF